MYIRAMQMFGSPGAWVTAGAILLSAYAAARIALHSIAEQRSMARKRATLDLLSAREWDRDYLEARVEFIKHRDSENGLETWAAEEHKDSPQLAKIRNSLNDYELIAIGIREGILDEELYKRWFRGSLLKDWKKSEKFVRYIQKRENSRKIYCEFEWLAVRWGGKAQHELPLSDTSKALNRTAQHGRAAGPG